MTDFNRPNSNFPGDEASSHISEDDSQSFKHEPFKPLLRAKGEAPFRDSWEAEAYALGNLLVKLNYITAKEWMELMAESIREAQDLGDPDTGETYYHHWCRSLEKYCFNTRLIDPEQHLKRLKLWRSAIINTPHGVPLCIENADLHALNEFHAGEHDVGHETTSQSASPDDEGHHHSHERPPVPPNTYYAPIVTQILKINP
ncbi:MAG: hypothetical protein VKP70_02935 [Cyanobacteriota bacterium]|nr:hypothetical protein [Cyanobacteriota bacterium]